MSEEADALAEAARNRGLKLVRSRVRTPGKRAFGKLGLTDSTGEPVFGMKNGKPAAKPEDVAEFLRGEGASDWKASLKAVGGKRARISRSGGERRAERDARGAEAQASVPPPPASPAASPRGGGAKRGKPEPGPLLREAKPGDAEQLVALFTLLDHRIDAKAVARNIKALATAGEPALVLARGKDILGMCGISRTVTPHRETPVGRITVLVVAEQARGKGFGRMLVEEAERRLAALGCGLIEVTSNDRLREAHAFYRHMGYERTSMRFAKPPSSG